MEILSVTVEPKLLPAAEPIATLVEPPTFLPALVPKAKLLYPVDPTPADSPIAVVCEPNACAFQPIAIALVGELLALAVF